MQEVRTVSIAEIGVLHPAFVWGSGRQSPVRGGCLAPPANQVIGLAASLLTSILNSSAAFFHMIISRSSSEMSSVLTNLR